MSVEAMNGQAAGVKPESRRMLLFLRHFFRRNPHPACRYLFYETNLCPETNCWISYLPEHLKKSASKEGLPDSASFFIS
jgi:hypothetical protein